MFTVVIPAFNSAQYLRETLDAIAGQVLLPDSVIVVDDGSVDDTGRIAESYAPLVRCLRVENGGQGLARRIGIAQAESAWIALCDSDDIWRPEHLSRRAELIRTFPEASFTFANFYAFGPGCPGGYTHLESAPVGWLEAWQDAIDGEFFTLHDPYEALLNFNPAYLSGVAFRRDAYDRMGGFLAKYSRWIGEDAEFSRRFMLLPGIVVAGDKAQTWGYRRHAENYSKTQWKNVYARARILQEHVELGLVPPALSDRVRAEISHTLERAYDLAFWERGFAGVLEIYDKLPQQSRTIGRSMKRFAARLRSTFRPESS